MLCNECYENIPQGEEIQTKDAAIICKDCAKNSVVYCSTCFPFRPLYNNYIVHESSRNGSKKISIGGLFSVNSNGSEKIIQCNLCYGKGRAEEERGEIYSKFVAATSPFLLLSLLFGTLHAIYPDKLDKFFKEHKNYCIYSLLIPLCFLIAYITVFIIFFPNRYKIRFRKKKQID